MKLIVALSALVLSASTALAGGYFGSTGVYYDDPDIYDPVPCRPSSSRGVSCTRRRLRRSIMCDGQSMSVDFGRCRTMDTTAVVSTAVISTAVASTACGGPIMGHVASTGCGALMGLAAFTGRAGRRTGRRLLDEGKERRRPPTRIRDRRRPLGPAA
jgi:hypothetical protein